jgi:hypothetical protein
LTTTAASTSTRFNSRLLRSGRWRTALGRLLRRRTALGRRLLARLRRRTALGRLLLARLGRRTALGWLLRSGRATLRLGWRLLSSGLLFSPCRRRSFRRPTSQLLTSPIGSSSTR